MQSIDASEDGPPLPLVIDAFFSFDACNGVDAHARARFLFSIFPPTLTSRRVFGAHDR
jgi:hypothetical protein